MDVHKHLHRHPGCWRACSRAARARELPVRSIDERMRAALQRPRACATNDHFIGDAGEEPYWTLGALREHLAALPARASRS